MIEKDRVEKDRLLGSINVSPKEDYSSLQKASDEKPASSEIVVEEIETKSDETRHISASDEASKHSEELSKEHDETDHNVEKLEEPSAWTIFKNGDLLDHLKKTDPMIGPKKDPKGKWAKELEEITQLEDYLLVALETDIPIEYYVALFEEVFEFNRQWSTRIGYDEKKELTESRTEFNKYLAENYRDISDDPLVITANLHIRDTSNTILKF